MASAAPEELLLCEALSLEDVPLCEETELLDEELINSPPFPASVPPHAVSAAIIQADPTARVIDAISMPRMAYSGNTGMIG